MRLFVLTLVSLALSGCATKYQDMGFTGGVAAEQITADTFRIVARGNAYTGGTRIQDFVLLKAAETTKSVGATHFIITASQHASRQSAIVTSATAQTTSAGGSAFTTFTPSGVHSYVKPGQDAYVRVLKLAPGSQAPPGALSADEIIQFVGPRLRG
jgi:hypothetical protein